MVNSQCSPLFLPDLQVFWGAVVDGEAHSGAYPMEAVAARRPGVDVEDSESFVVTHAQDVAMAADKNRGAQGADLGIDLLQVPPAIEANVCHQDAGTLPLEALPLGVGEPLSLIHI